MIIFGALQTMLVRNTGWVSIENRSLAGGIDTMEGIDLTSIYTTIGGVLGTPAAIAFFYLWNKVKELEKRLDAGQTRFDRMDAELKEINKSLNIIIGKVDTMLRRSGHTPEDA